MFSGHSGREEFMIKVGIVGYGTIGKRVADAVLLQNDMELTGVTANTCLLYTSDAADE